MVAPLTPAIDDRLMMMPPPWAIICRPAHLQPKNTPFRLMPITAFHPLTVISSGFARNDAPALLTMTSSRPRSRAVRSTSSRTASSCLTSTAMAKERRPSFSISARTGSRFSIFRLATTTSAPARANSMAMDRPMPTPPPVTMAIFCSRENGDAAMRPPDREPAPWWAGRWGWHHAALKPPRLYPAGRRGALEGQGLARAGVHEREPRRVEREPPEWIAPTAVLLVAEDRVPDQGELHADLPSPPGAERQRERGGVGAAREDAVVGDRDSPRRARADAEIAALDEAGLERAGVGPDAPLDRGHVAALGGSRLELGLELTLGHRRLREHEEPRRVPVQPMHDEGAVRGPLSGEIVPEKPVGGPLALSLGRDREEPGWLVDHQQVLVFVEEPERGGEGRGARHAGVLSDAPEPHPIIGPDGAPAISRDLPVDLDAPALEPLLEAMAGRLGIQRAESVDD